MLVDTDIVIDLWRQHAPAVAWFASVGPGILGLPGIVAFEMLAGCKDSREQSRVGQLLRNYRVAWPTERDCERAFITYARHVLSHGIGMNDCLIGETAVGLGMPLVTFNVKHYSLITGLTTIQPY